MPPADGQSGAPLPAPNPAQPPLVLPLTTGPAIEDPNTALLQQARARLVRVGFAPLFSVLVLTGFLASQVLQHQPVHLAVDLVVGGILVAFLLVLLIVRLWLHVPPQRRGKELLPRYPWRGVPVTVLANNPCLVRVALDGRELTLRLRRLNWLGKQVLLRTGVLWICGPDERGRALVRIAGSVGEALAEVTVAAPSGPPPVLAQPSGPRPADDPALSWIRRATNRNVVIYTAILVLLEGLTVGALSRADYTDIDPIVIGGVTGVTMALVLVIWGWWLGNSQYRRLAAAPYWQPIQVSLDTWNADINVSVRNGSGRIILPNGWRGYVEFPRLPLDFAANLRATGVLWVAGDPVPGQTVPIGLPGYPLRGVVKIKP